MKYQKKQIRVRIYASYQKKQQSNKRNYIWKLRKDFEVLYKQIEKKYSQLYQKIEKSFKNENQESLIFEQGFKSLQVRLNYLQSLNCQKDIDILKINQLSQDILEQDINLEYFLQIDVAKSIFVNDPKDKLEYILSEFDFKEVNQRHLTHMQYIFADSKILTKQHITNDLFVLFPQIDQAQLLYSINLHGPTPQIFHKQCNNQGPTIMFVKANKHNIFGGYNSTSWLNSYCYSDSEENFLFKICSKDPNIKPFKCPIKKEKSQFAIKQSENNFSPGFGESNKCDLFISFKNPNKSYSKLGNCYQIPLQFYNLSQDQIYSLLSGKESNWDIEELEIYSVKVIDNI